MIVVIKNQQTRVLLFLLQLPGLTKKTALALRQTSQAMTGLSRYLFNKCGFRYVLLGKMQSDNIEGRFGHIRQLSGGNYYISMRHLYENDRKLRTVSLLKYTKISVAEIDETAKTKCSPEQEVSAKAKSLQAELLFNILLTKSDAAIIFYITGNCCKSLIKSTKRDACRATTILDVEDAAAEITTDLTNSVKRFFNSMNRGGLWQPTPAYFKVGILCWRILAELSQNDLKKSFLNGLRQ